MELAETATAVAVGLRRTEKPSLPAAKLAVAVVASVAAAAAVVAVVVAAAAVDAAGTEIVPASVPSADSVQYSPASGTGRYLNV